MPMTLYKLDASPPARAVCMTLHALNIPESDVEYVDVNLLEGEHLTEDYLKMNPQHTIPTLKDDDFIIWDSHAISTYLINKQKDDSLYPADLKKRAIIDQRMHFDSGILFPALRQTIMPVIFLGEKAFKPENLDGIKAAYKFADGFLKTSLWMAGDVITVADICCIATISTMNEVVPIKENEYPNLSAWLNRCSQQDFYKKGNEKGLEEIAKVLNSKLS